MFVYIFFLISNRYWLWYGYLKQHHFCLLQCDFMLDLFITCMFRCILFCRGDIATIPGTHGIVMRLYQMQTTLSTFTDERNSLGNLTGFNNTKNSSDRAVSASEQFWKWVTILHFTLLTHNNTIFHTVYHVANTIFPHHITHNNTIFHTVYHVAIPYFPPHNT